MPNRIEGFPEQIATVPETAYEWLLWREKVLAFRELIHRQAEQGPAQKAAIVELCKNDPVFFMAIFGVLLDPKGETDLRVDEHGKIVDMPKPRGWYPWIPYPFQVETVRWYQDVQSRDYDPTGKGDGVVEKSRDMGITWTFCLIAAHEWLFLDDALIGFISHKEELVDSDKPKSMFYKLRSLIGINKFARIPERTYAPDTVYHLAPCRLPDWLVPGGFDPKLHDHKLSLKHPSRTNQISGESTTSRTGIGDRQSAVFIDEGSKNDKLSDIWSGLSAVTNHRYVFSSADRREGDGMYALVEKARAARYNPRQEGPSLLTLPWHAHPLRDDTWFANMRARHSDDIAGFEREYEINWNAGIGDWVYPAAASIIPGDYPYDPLAGDVYITIDPGLRDPTAIQWYQYLPATGDTYALFDAITINIPSAQYLTPILMGWPPGHDMRMEQDYANSHDIQEIMDVMWQLREMGRSVTFVGDPYGDNAGGAMAQSFYTSMYLTSRELNQKYPDLKPFEIQVITKYDEGARYHRARKESLTRLLPLLRFNDLARVRYVIDALRAHRYKPMDTGRSAMSEPNSPVHDWTSHHASAAEYFAVLVRGREVASLPMLKPTKTTVRNRHKKLGWDSAWT
ncbi:hypothetical protein [Methylobacillus sp.]|uniref:hypothetical protein n=1 Tax=Methylobacillus sp. TaxID=56818 RepID=UPI002FE1AF74